MIWILFTFSLSILKVSDRDIRLPIYNPQEGTRPYKLVKFHSSDIDISVENDKLIDAEVVARDSLSITVNISVKYDKKVPIETKIILEIGEKKNDYVIYIDIIDHISIETSVPTLTVNNLTPFQVIAYNAKNETFSSLDGVKLEWGIPVGKELFGFFLPDEEALKEFYSSIPSNYVIVRGIKNGYGELTCKLTNLKLEAKYELKFEALLVFEPNEIFTTQNSEISLLLCYAEKNRELLGSIDLKKEYDDYTLVSDKPEVASVSKEGEVKTGELGTATITVYDNKNISKPAKVVVHVIYPNGFKWDEQWIRPSEEPDIKSVRVYYQNNIVTFSRDCPIKMETSFKKTGTNLVRLVFPTINYTIEGIVHNCFQPLTDKVNMSISVGEENKPFKVLGGSGHFKLHFDESLIKIEVASSKEGEDGLVVTNFLVSSLKAGKTMVRITDEKIKDYETEIEIVSIESSEL